MGYGNILVVDDDQLMLDFLKEALVRQGYNVDTAEDGREALDKVKGKGYDLVITDVRMPGVDGMTVLESVKRDFPNTDVVVITAYGTIRNAVEAMRMGAYDYLTKPFSVDEVELVVSRALERRKLILENIRLRQELEKVQGLRTLIGQSPAMRKVLEMVEMVAPTRATVLIQGESGTGKELIADAIHRLSPRKDGPFVKVNCAALPEGLVESELFGHEKGAFTHAVKRFRGRFELADGGTLLLDEIGEVSPSVQVKLLRVLQEGIFERVGGEESLQVDVRVIATTNKDLWKAVQEGKFREDLYYRLQVVPIYIPPLRERKEDIPLLVQHFLRKYGRQEGKEKLAVSERALEMLTSYDWPGNVRELENAIERAVILTKGKVLKPEHFLIGGIRREKEPDEGPVTLEEMERRLILRTLREEGGHRTRTAQRLGISVRTLRNKLNQYRREGFL
ncbi:MAG TPA: sigma-54-dependent Fis family transcriptional regulator [Candidatus Latescibacteria bacterium]|nr:sigma-54-dependent Fis family transcriptional regulator [Candidatus Latescibacterota bacterium]